MPNGFGFNWPGHASTEAYKLIGRVPLRPAGLPSAAQTAIRDLAAADGITIPAAPAQRGSSAAHPSRGSGDTTLIAVAVGVLVALGLAFALVTLGRRRPRRQLAASRPLRATALARPPRARWALPAGIVLGALAIGAPIVALSRVRHASSSTEPASVVTPPPFSWPAGRRAAPDFVLHDQHGSPVSIAAFRGRPVIVTFIDPLCRNLCPLEAKVLNAAVGRMPSSQRPEILAVSVDAYANARRNLLQDVRKWQLVPQWRWAVGTRAELARVWKRYSVGVSVVTKRIAGDTINYITHTEAAYVVDRTGHERALFVWPFYPQDVERVLSELA
jgi:cytochrome oxidase Cu insertion factor (SCO1/SenC/PrrC family)